MAGRHQGASSGVGNMESDRETQGDIGAVGVFSGVVCLFCKPGSLAGLELAKYTRQSLIYIVTSNSSDSGDSPHHPGAPRGTLPFANLI